MTDNGTPDWSLDATQDEDLAARWAALPPDRRAILLDAGRGLPDPGDDLPRHRALAELRSFGYLTGEGAEDASLTTLGERLAAFGRRA